MELYTMKSAFLQDVIFKGEVGQHIVTLGVNHKLGCELENDFPVGLEGPCMMLGLNTG